MSVVIGKLEPRRTSVKTGPSNILQVNTLLEPIASASSAPSVQCPVHMWACGVRKQGGRGKRPRVGAGKTGGVWRGPGSVL